MVSPKARKYMVVGNNVKILSFRVAVRKYRMKRAEERKGERMRFPRNNVKK